MRTIALSVECDSCKETADKELTAKGQPGMDYYDIDIANRSLKDSGWRISDEADLCPDCVKAKNKITIRITDCVGKDIFEGDLKDLLTGEGDVVLPLPDFTEIWVNCKYYADVDYFSGAEQ